jgi:hypothetical protein
MVEQFVFEREFFTLLEQEDERIAERVAAAGCAECGGPLYRSDYDRKPRGAQIAAGAESSVRRFSLCCGREGCRHRATPPSLRFLGRRVYVGAVVIAASIVGLLLQAAGVIRKTTGVPARTVRRWLAWWQGPFLTTLVFVAVRARLIDVAVDALPKSIMDRLGGAAEQRMQVMLVLLAPLTTRSVTEGARFLRATGVDNK